MTDFHGDQNYPNTLMNRIFRRVGKPVPSRAEQVQAQRDILYVNGRMSPEKFRKLMKKSHIAYGAIFGFMFIGYLLLIVVPNKSQTTFADYVLCACSLLASIEYLVIPSIRRLHDAGQSGFKLLVPWQAVRLLKLPSGPPNKWGDGPS